MVLCRALLRKGKRSLSLKVYYYQKYNNNKKVSEILINHLPDFNIQKQHKTQAITVTQ